MPGLGHRPGKDTCPLRRFRRPERHMYRSQSSLTSLQGRTETSE
jgi:hypothetical protein